MHWTGYPVERVNELTKARVTETVYMCDDLWNTKIAFDAAKFADQAGASFDALRGETAKQQNEGLRRQDDFFDVLARGILSHVDTRLEHSSNPSESLPSPPEPS